MESGESEFFFGVMNIISICTIEEGTMKTIGIMLIACTILLVGCSNKEKEQQLQSQLAQVQSDHTALEKSLSERDQYFEEVLKTVNDVYTDLEKSKAKEHTLVPLSPGGHDNPQVGFANSRERLLSSINEIGSSLKDNRKRISGLEARLRASHVENEGLTKLIENLKSTIAEREQSIAQLEANVKGLQATVAEKTKLVQDKESTIDEQQRKMNTVYYIAGTRAELKKKGIITEDGGFLWGLLGSTTVVAGGFDPSEFSTFDKTSGQAIHLEGKVDEILPKRSPELYASSMPDEKSSDLKILQPDKFWRNNYLVVVLD
jgi:outer membrane murein-binding lipoprotein Lpp